MSERAGAPWLLYILVALCILAGVAAFLVVGPPAQSASPTRTATVGRGVVQSTVSASGALAAVGESSVNFKTAGTLAAVYVHVGEHVLEGRLLAELNPDAAQRNLAVAEDNLRAAEDRLDATNNESTEAGESSSTATATTSSASPSPTAKPKSKSKSTPAKSAPESKATSESKANPESRSTPNSTSAQPAQSPQARAANVAGDEASVESARANVVSAEEALANTKLYAPADGTVASIAAETPGASVSASSGANTGTGASSGSSAGGSSGSGSSGGGGGASSGTGSANSGSSSSSSSGFVVLVNASDMQVVVPLSESDITKVKVGQPATVTVNALPDEKLAARVVSSALLSTTNSGVVSYDVTLNLEQSASGLRPGMTASAQIVVAQAENAVNVTSSAISGRGAAQTVTVLRSGKPLRVPVVTGLVGDSVTQILSGVSPGEQVQVPIATGASLGGGSGLATGAFGGRAGGLGAGGGLGGGGGVRFFGGGGAG
jgi:multidrug efflux pump subunit AcrA (membrane-fusion protein)